MELLLRPWKLYADPSGRSTPAEFWLFFGVKYGVLFAIAIPLGAMGAFDRAQMTVLETTAACFAGFFFLSAFIPSCVLLVRRCHDFDATGKWALTSFIPYLGYIAVLVIGVIPGTKGENSRGHDPREPDPYSLSATFE